MDDDPILRETLSVVLRNEGFAVTPAASGEEAEHILAFAAPPFPLVLTDLVMPGKSGMDVLKKALETNPSATVLILTGYGSVREATETMDHGAYGMVTKPLQLDLFRNILRRILERMELLSERDRLRTQVRELQLKVERLEATKGRMEMLAHRIDAADLSSEALEDLERLAGLKTRGLLSDEQYEAAKKALLSRWLA